MGLSTQDLLPPTTWLTNTNTTPFMERPSKLLRLTEISWSWTGRRFLRADAATLRKLVGVDLALITSVSQPESSLQRRKLRLSLTEVRRRSSTLPLPRMTPKLLLWELTLMTMMD